MREHGLFFGPLPSRRLGRSLGINNIPAKVCTYSCVYCQAGRTLDLTVDRKIFHSPGSIFEGAEARLTILRERGEAIDYLTIVPHGEPTLDDNLGREIELLRPLGLKIAVISNASLLFVTAVREGLSRADYASLKIDAASECVGFAAGCPTQPRLPSLN